MTGDQGLEGKDSGTNEILLARTPNTNKKKEANSTRMGEHDGTNTDDCIPGHFNTKLVTCR
jgi:hypothetical protein